MMFSRDDDLVEEILVRLPVKSLMRFKCVDPCWKEMFTRPSFISKNMYHNKKEHAIVLISRGFPGMMISADNYEESECPPFPDDLNIIDVNFIGGGSYNGVFCIQSSRGQNNQLYFWNPSTREFNLVPSPPYSYIDPSYAYADHLCCFGGNPNTNDLNLFYLFVLTEYDDHNIRHFLPPSIELYSLTTNSWTILDNLLPVPSQFILPQDGVLANGVSHWIAEREDDRHHQFILCFDFRNNQFRKLECLPLNIKHKNGCQAGYHFLAEINNSIAYVVRRNRGVDIWIPEDDEGCCWTKRYIFEPLDGPGPLRVYTIWKDGAEFLGPSRYQNFYCHWDDRKLYSLSHYTEPVYLASYNSAGQQVHCSRQLMPPMRILKYVETIAPLSFS